MQNGKASTVDIHTIKEDFAAVFQRLRDSLPESSCTLELDTTGTQDSDIVAKLKPSHEKCASIDARLDLDFGVYLSLGRGTLFEIPLKGKRYTDLPFIEEVERICKAVTLGNFEEDVSFVGDTSSTRDKVSSATGAVLIEGQKGMISDSWAKIGWNLVKKVRKFHFTYEPYAK